jgi:hypothetical protein
MELFGAGLPGWTAEDAAGMCGWVGVQCNEEGRVEGGVAAAHA